MPFGAFNPAPRRMGGGTPRAKLIFDALVAARGTAIAAGDPNTTAYVETLAIARAISSAWGTNERLSNQWDARRMTSMISRWEVIFNLRSHPDDRAETRRHQIELAQARVGRGALLTTITAELSDAVGDKFVGVEFISVPNAVLTMPSAAYLFPGGLVIPGAPWSSSVAHLLVQLTATGTESDFYDAIGIVADRLEPLLPAWTTWDWYRAPAGGVPLIVNGGPQAGGFYLDDEHNLDNNVFDDGTGTYPGHWAFNIEPTTIGIGGGKVRVTGYALDATTGLNVDGVYAASFTHVNNGELSAVVAPHAAGVVDVLVHSPIADVLLPGGLTFA